MKKTNRIQTPVVTVMVATGNQNMVTSGSLTSSSTALNIADGQLGMLSWDWDGVTTLGNFIANSEADVADVSAIKMIRGTSKSGSTHTVDPWEVNDPAYVESDVIYKDSIYSVATTEYTVPSYSAYAITDVPTITASTEYGAYTYLYSVRDDRDYGDNDNVAFEGITTPSSLSDIDDDTEYVLANIAYRHNTRSRLASVSNSSSIRRGNKNYIVLGVNSGGSFGQTIGDITCASTPTSFDIMKDYDSQGNAITTTMTANVELVKALGRLIKKQADEVTAGATITNQITNSSTIEVIDPVNGYQGVQAQGTITIANNTNLATDTFTVGSTDFVEGTDFDAGSDNTAAQLAVTATNLAEAINNSSEAVTATSSGAVVTITANAYGTSGNSIVLTYTDQGSDGADVSGSGTLAGGAATNIDSLIFIGLDHTKSKYADNIMQVMTTIDVNLTSSFTNTYETQVTPEEGTGQGWKWVIENDDRAQLQVHTQQNQPFMEEFSKGYSHIVGTDNYTTTTIEYYDVENTMTTRETHPKKLHILLPSAATCTTVSGVVTNLASGDAIATATSATNTVTDLNNTLGAWLITAQPYSGHRVLGDATSSTYFV